MSRVIFSDALDWCLFADADAVVVVVVVIVIVVGLVLIDCDVVSMKHCKGILKSQTAYAFD